MKCIWRFRWAAVSASPKLSKNPGRCHRPAGGLTPAFLLSQHLRVATDRERLPRNRLAARTTHENDLVRELVRRHIFLDRGVGERRAFHLGVGNAALLR